MHRCASRMIHEHKLRIRKHFVHVFKWVQLFTIPLLSIYLKAAHIYLDLFVIFVYQNENHCFSCCHARSFWFSIETKRVLLFPSQETILLILMKKNARMDSKIPIPILQIPSKQSTWKIRLVKYCNDTPYCFVRKQLNTMFPEGTFTDPSGHR